MNDSDFSPVDFYPWATGLSLGAAAYYASYLRQLSKALRTLSLYDDYAMRLGPRMRYLDSLHGAVQDAADVMNRVGREIDRLVYPPGQQIDPRLLPSVIRNLERIYLATPMPPGMLRRIHNTVQNVAREVSDPNPFRPTDRQYLMRLRNLAESSGYRTLHRYRRSLVDWANEASIMGERMRGAYEQARRQVRLAPYRALIPGALGALGGYGMTWALRRYLPPHLRLQGF